MSKNKDNMRMGNRRGGRLGHGPGRMMPGRKAKDFKGTVRRLWKYLSEYKKAFIIVIIFSMASVVFSIYGPKLMGKATTAIYKGLVDKITGTGEGIDFKYIGNIILILAALYGFSTLFRYIQGFIMADVSTSVSYRMRKAIIEKINRMPLKYFDGTNHGEVLSRMTNDVDMVSRTLSQSLSQMVTSGTTIIGVLIMMISISWRMTLLALGIIPLSIIVTIFIVKQSQKYFKKRQEYLGNVNGHIEEIYSGHTIIKAFNGEAESLEKFDEMNEKLYRTSWKAQFLSGIMMPLMNVVGNIGYVAVSVLGGTLAAKGIIEIGDILAFIQYVKNFTQPISQMANVSNMMQQTVAAAERVFEFLDEEEEVPETDTPVRKEDIEGRVNFKNVSFGYNKDKVIIKAFSADIKSGERVAIVGPTGAGKTTMVKLLMRFYDVNRGSIKIDGIDIKDYTRDDLRKMFGMVLQDTWLYNGTIMDNIRYGRLDATDSEVIEAAKAAHVDSFVHMLPEGYNMLLNEDATNVSQGQKQLITIARAILSDPKVLILDEATSSVDTRTEQQIQKAMNNLMEGKTSFIIAHRLSTIRDADMILVMNDGDIVEQGAHHELMEQGGFYANLYNSQFESEEVI